MQYFPKFENEISTLKRIIINDSTVTFDSENVDHYSNLENLEYLDLSYNNIEELSEQFKRFYNLNTLYLKRNSLKSLPQSFIEMENLTELNLTDNKLTRVPNLNFAKLVKLNLNMNHLETFESQVTINSPPLEYLMLANNELSEIPKDIIKFKNLKHVALDSNKLKEISDWVKNDFDFKVNISLMNNNNMKNKEMFILENNPDAKDILVNEILYINAIVKNNLNNFDLQNNPNLSIDEKNSDKENMNEDLDFVNKEDVMEIEKIIKMEEIKNAKHIIEINIKKKIDEMIKNKRNSNKNIALDLFRKIVIECKQKIVSDELKRMIENKQESEISKFGDFELKSLMKICYNYMNKYNQFLITGELPKDVIDEEMEIFLYVFNMSREKYEEIKYQISENENSKKINSNNNKNDKNKNDMNNLLFLNNLSNLLINSKMKIFLKYIANIDLKLSEYFRNLTDDYDMNSFILLITELKLFLKETIEYYESISGDILEVSYKFKISQNVIHKIFKENVTVTILYRLGLKEFKIKNENETAEFVINHSMYEKHRLVFSFVKRLIKMIKVNNLKVLIVN